MKDVRKYELTLIISPKTREKERKKIVAEIRKIVEREKGKIEKITAWGKKFFAYLIEKEKEGWYYLVWFSLAPEKLPLLERELKLEKKVLRYLIIREP